MLLKICGMTRQEDINVAERAGFNLCGFIFHSHSPRSITSRQVAALKTGKMLRVGVFVQQTGPEICEIMCQAKLDYAQLHGDQSEADALLIGPERVIRVLWPERFHQIKDLEIRALNHRCRYFLLDAGSSGGGSGQRIASKSLSQIELPHPWLLAGGLNHNNIHLCLNHCSPAGLDFNSGLEDSPGIKNHTKIKAAARAVLEIKR